ncbi:MAG: TIGR04552 family protein [Cyanobacteria bacterium P01_H01_bin.74]
MINTRDPSPSQQWKQRLTEEPRIDAASPDLPWAVMETLIEGRSSIDLDLMPVSSREEASDLVYQYGFNLSLPADVADVQAYMTEALNFIAYRFLSHATDWPSFGEPEAPLSEAPESIRACNDIVELLLIASSKTDVNRYWACALLKVIHTLVYIDNTPLYQYLDMASQAIMKRFEALITPEADGSMLLKGRYGQSLKLYAFQTKTRKSRESILMKLLSKKENVAENIWDLVGVRLVTFYPAEAILALEILRSQKVILFPNIVPSRSTNNLIDFDAFKRFYTAQNNAYQTGQIDFEAMAAVFQDAGLLYPEKRHPRENPMSSPAFRSLNVTCRHLLKTTGLAESVDSKNSPDTPKRSGTRFAFPYEIQFLDQTSYLQSQSGYESHNNYKQRQLFAARRRVLGALLNPKVV